MVRTFTGFCINLLRTIQKKLLKFKFRKKLYPHKNCYISQNCIGGRFYELEGRAYTSPTVGLWFKADDFIKFCQNINENIKSKISPDEIETKKMGYPVGIINGIKIYFQHYPTFEAATSAWHRRASRLRLEDIFIVMTDRDGFSARTHEDFLGLKTHRKVLFSHSRAWDGPNIIHVPGYEQDGCVGDLYGAYDKFSDKKVESRLLELLAKSN